MLDLDESETQSERAFRLVHPTMRKSFHLTPIQCNCIILISFAISASIILFVFALLNLGSSSTLPSQAAVVSAAFEDPDVIFSQPSLLSPEMPPLPRFAYLISGTKGDAKNMRRLLQAVYHPRNFYLLNLDLEAPIEERVALSKVVKQFSSLYRYANVHLVEKPDLITYKGSSMIASTLHGAAVLLKLTDNWDWFINLSATDYPLVTQDDLLYIFSFLPKDLNFIEHTSNLDWREFQRAKPLIIDPGLYMNKKTDIIWITQRRSVPQAFRLFIGSAWVILTRSFMEYCIHGWDNLPRTLLLYHANSVSSPESYFHTVICNSRDFRNTTVNHDLHYILWDDPPRQHPITLSVEHFENMTASGAAFARKFRGDDSVLDKIDKELLGRKSDQITPGGWCLGNDNWGDTCALLGNPNILYPTAGAKRLESLVVKLLSSEFFRGSQCA